MTNALYDRCCGECQYLVKLHGYPTKHGICRNYQSGWYGQEKEDFDGSQCFFFERKPM